MDSNVEKRPPSLNVFQVRGIAPDVHLEVFGSYVHAHSVVLKMHSQFFYSFLDAPGSAAPIVGPNFKYSWITKVLDDGKDWQLVSKNETAGDLALSSFKGDPEQQTGALYKLLCAMYSRPYDLDSPQELLRMTSLARFYMALPILSRSLSAALLHSKQFVNRMAEYSETLLVAAKELRHAEFFKDCLLLSLGLWRSPFRTSIKDLEIKAILITAHGKICSKLVEVQMGLVFSLSGSALCYSDGQKLAHTQAQVAEEIVDHSSPNYACLPCFYRGLYKADGGIFDHDLKQKLEIILGNKLILPTDRKHDCHFLFLEIGDNELPWDRAQTDW